MQTPSKGPGHASGATEKTLLKLASVTESFRKNKITAEDIKGFLLLQSDEHVSQAYKEELRNQKRYLLGADDHKTKTITKQQAPEHIIQLTRWNDNNSTGLNNCFFNYLNTKADSFAKTIEQIRDLELSEKPTDFDTDEIRSAKIYFGLLKAKESGERLDFGNFLHSDNNDILEKFCDSEEFQEFKKFNEKDEEKKRKTKGTKPRNSTSSVLGSVVTQGPHPIVNHHLFQQFLPQQCPRFLVLDRNQFLP